MPSNCNNPLRPQQFRRSPPHTRRYAHTHIISKDTMRASSGWLKSPSISKFPIDIASEAHRNHWVFVINSTRKPSIAAALADNLLAWMCNGWHRWQTHNALACVWWLYQFSFQAGLDASLFLSKCHHYGRIIFIRAHRKKGANRFSSHFSDEKCNKFVYKLILIYDKWFLFRNFCTGFSPGNSMQTQTYWTQYRFFVINFFAPPPSLDASAIIPNTTSEAETHEFLMKVVDILLDYVKTQNDRSARILEFHHPEDMKKLLDLDLPENALPLQQLIQDCASTLRYQVKTGESMLVIVCIVTFYRVNAGTVIAFIIWFLRYGPFMCHPYTNLALN